MSDPAYDMGLAVGEMRGEMRLLADRVGQAVERFVQGERRRADEEVRRSGEVSALTEGLAKLEMRLLKVEQRLDSMVVVVPEVAEP